MVLQLNSQWQLNYTHLLGSHIRLAEEAKEMVSQASSL